MKVIIQDLPAEAFSTICPPSLENIHVITNESDRIKHCIGCFGCWVKTPGICVIKDGYGDLGKLYAECDELIVKSAIRRVQRFCQECNGSEYWISTTLFYGSQK